MYIRKNASVKTDGDDHFEDHVAPHVVDALPTCRMVHIAIFQSAQVVLISLVQQVLGCDVEFGNLLLVNVQIGACRQTQQRVTERARRGLIHLIIMILRQIALQPQGYEGIVQRFVTVMRQFILQFRSPADPPDGCLRSSR